MNHILKKPLLIILWFVAASSCAQSKKSTAASNFLEVKETWTQRTLPGRKEGNIETLFHSVCKWQTADTPEALYLKSGELWMSCDLMQENHPLRLAELHKGTQFELLAHSSKTIHPPTTIPDQISTAIVFKITNNWYYLPINGIIKKPDAVMP